MDRTARVAYTTEQVASGGDLVVTHSCVYPSGEKRAILRLRFPVVGTDLPELDLYARTARMEIRSDHVHYVLAP